MAGKTAEEAASEEQSRVIKIQARVLKRHERDARELAKWQREKAKPKKRAYLWYLMLILTFVYIVDEVATNLNSTMQPYMIGEFFVAQQNLEPNKAQAAWQGYGTIAQVLSLTVLVYRPLADRFGRKIFLVINTICMGLGMLLCFWSPIFLVYLIGFFFLTFMTGPDMQVVYITECAPKKHRAAFVSVIKGLAQLGIALIGIGMTSFMQGNNAKWRWVFLIPACLGFLVALLALLFTRETDQFIDERIAYLAKRDEEKTQMLLDKTKKNENSQGGVIAVARFGFRHHQLKWLFIASMLYTTAFYATGYYGQTISDAGYSSSQLAEVALVWPFVCSFITVVYGLISDRVGRKKVAIGLGSLVLLGLALMSCGLYLGWNEYLVGAFLGLFLAGYWNLGDTLILMVSESAPTNLRSSAAGDQSMFAVLGYLVGFITIILYTNFSSVSALAYLDFIFLALAVPGILGTILVLTLKVSETKGIDLNLVKGDEWDKKTEAKSLQS
jgi:MFS family permease